MQAKVYTVSIDLCYMYTVEPLWKGQECLTKIAKFGPFPCAILYKSCLFYPSSQVTSFERPPSWLASIQGFQYISIYHKIHVYGAWIVHWTVEIPSLMHMDIALPYVIFSIDDPLTVWSFILELSFSYLRLFVMHFCMDYDCWIIAVLVHGCTAGWNVCRSISCSCIRQKWI